MKPIIFALAATFALASCSGRNARSLYDEARQAEDSAKFADAALKYEELVREYPTEALAETALYKVVQIRSNATGDRGPAVDAQRRFLELFPRSGWAPKVTFMLAFNYNNELAQYDSAKKYYTLFLERYPNDELAPSAKFELETIGQGPEELLLRHSQAASDAEKPAAGATGGGKGARPR